MSATLQEASSLKSLIQEMQVESMEVLEGRVTSESPLRIQLLNDDKLELSQNIICLPTHLTTYKTTVDISGGSVNIQMSSDGSHDHGSGGDHTHDSGDHEGHEDGGDGSHSHSGGSHSHGTAGNHSHRVTSFAVTGADMTVYNSLHAGDVVYLLSFNNGKRYYVLDREGS